MIIISRQGINLCLLVIYNFAMVNYYYFLGEGGDAWGRAAGRFRSKEI